MESKRLDNAALAAGISPNYINAHGKPQSISAETKRRLLDAMHQRTATKVAVTVRFTAGYPRHQTGFADIVIKRFLDVTLSVTAFIRIRADTEFTGQYL